MYISIDAFRSFDEAAQNFLQYPTSTLDEKCHLSVVTFFFSRLVCQTSFMVEFLFLTLCIYFEAKIQCYF